ncbi:hypothetical protein BJV74DRAFT_796511 [Russula compacta]|nr:hypothetical protein BJV74DRAFT_796511 [Russula compacta]
MTDPCPVSVASVSKLPRDWLSNPVGSEARLARPSQSVASGSEVFVLGAGCSRRGDLLRYGTVERRRYAVPTYMALVESAILWDSTSGGEVGAGRQTEQHPRDGIPVTQRSRWPYRGAVRLRMPKPMRDIEHRTHPPETQPGSGTAVSCDVYVNGEIASGAKRRAPQVLPVRKCCQDEKKEHIGSADATISHSPPMGILAWGVTQSPALTAAPAPAAAQEKPGGGKSWSQLFLSLASAAHLDTRPRVGETARAADNTNLFMPPHRLHLHRGGGGMADAHG